MEAPPRVAVWMLYLERERYAALAFTSILLAELWREAVWDIESHWLSDARASKHLGPFPAATPVR